MFGLGKDSRLLYEMGFVPSTNPALSIRIRKDLIKFLEIDKSLVAEKVKQFEFQSFSGFGDGNFGFDGAFQKKKERSEDIEFIIPIPQALSAHSPAWKPVHAAVQSISLFTELVRSFYRPSLFSSGKRQLISLFVVANHERGLYAVAGDYSSTLCDWLDNIASNDDLKNTARAMEQTYSYLWNRPRCGNFLAYLHEGGCLTVQCPSHCIVSPRSLRQKNRGVEFDTSEMRHEVEALVILSGLFALCETAGRDIYGSSY
ncbi:MAG: hypothetical protein WC428_07925 [Candidatus Paceibacterota bacterium]